MPTRWHSVLVDSKSRKQSKCITKAHIVQHQPQLTPLPRDCERIDSNTATEAETDSNSTERIGSNILLSRKAEFSRAERLAHSFSVLGSLIFCAHPFHKPQSLSWLQMVQGLSFENVSSSHKAYYTGTCTLGRTTIPRFFLRFSFLENFGHCNCNLPVGKAAVSTIAAVMNVLFPLPRRRGLSDPRVRILE